ncbi:MAG: hypothetical protein ACKVOH_00790 [Chlamydiales bacterium]
MKTEEDSETGLLTLQLHLVDGQLISIPKLEHSIIDIAFSAHLQYFELKGEVPKKSASTPLFGLTPDQVANLPIRFGISGLPGVENLENAMQHNQAMANTADIPPEVLEKISGIAKLVTNGDLDAFPKAEPHCNCVHCQLARAIHGVPKEAVEEPVSEEDLQFHNWDIHQIGENLYSVTNPLDVHEHYNVFLGNPVGCTCGHEHCEHIKAVLSS